MPKSPNLLILQGIRGSFCVDQRMTNAGKPLFMKGKPQKRT